MALTALGSTALTQIAFAKDKDMSRWECQNSECEPFVYDPKIARPDMELPAGIPFADLPDDWVCPICGDSKRQFKRLKS